MPTVTLDHKSRRGVPIVNVVKTRENVGWGGYVYKEALVEYYDGERKWLRMDNSLLDMLNHL